MVLKAPLQKESPNQSLPKVFSEAGVRRCSSKLVFSKFHNIYRKTSVLESVFNKVEKEMNVVFSCEYCEIF